MSKRKIYLAKKSLAEAKIIWNKYLNKVKAKKETIPVKEALNRITASPVQAERSAPNFNASAMDGIAVSSEDTIGATEREPLTLKNNQFEYINTGNLYQKVTMQLSKLKISISSVQKSRSLNQFHPGIISGQSEKV